MATLYQFPFSHFCEKARWAMDYKGPSYTVDNLLPGPHLKVIRKLARKSSVPVLVDDDVTVQGSTAIIDYLDQRYADNPLTPGDPALEREAREWETFLDEEIGVALRAWFYYYILPIKKSALTFLLHDGPWYGAALYAFIFPKLRATMIRFMNINAENAELSEQRLVAALTRLEGVINDQKFLVGDKFSRADLTACALLSPLVSPHPTIEAVYPAPICAFRDRFAGRPVFEWVNEIYRDHRHIAR